ncbi:hypothetical protein THAOC_17904 [Thalassiosira oceanica]|uniref:Uncharacterized protein n=1 Tax=Thalassiosira oceanica TaxID=159749 RepID=K0S9J0_THAOC|nr:hypothetical protein THAOC_17904 [Thalassiosira oceanica]|eukprot:EJK61584.1 hypothetical protein THAOC_17904 [Thalassiosira oceanica]
MVGEPEAKVRLRRLDVVVSCIEWSKARRLEGIPTDTNHQPPKHNAQVRGIVRADPQGRPRSRLICPPRGTPRSQGTPGGYGGFPAERTEPLLPPPWSVPISPRGTEETRRGSAPSLPLDNRPPSGRLGVGPAPGEAGGRSPVARSCLAQGRRTATPCPVSSFELDDRGFGGRRVSAREDRPPPRDLSHPLGGPARASPNPPAAKL